MVKLREAKIEDYWRAALRRRYGFQVLSLESKDEAILPGANLSLANGVSAIVGKNGVGKSTLVQALYDCLATEGGNRPRFQTILDESDIQLEVDIDRDTLSHTSTPKDFSESSGWGVQAFMYDPCALAHQLQSKLRRESNLDELLEAHGEVEVDQDFLEILTYVSMASYDDVRLILVENEFTDFPMMPFFRVSREGVHYDNRTMGLGELSLFYFCWLID